VATNPIRIDPSRTIAIRTAFVADMKRRFKAVEKDIWDVIVVKDVLGLKENSPMLFNIEKQAYKFLTSDKKLESFNTWFSNQVDQRVLTVDGQGQPWSNKYVGSAYRKGVVRAYADTHRELMTPGMEFYKGSREQFLRSMFAQPERIAKLRLLYTRTFEGMKGVTARAKQEMSRVLASGIANGGGPVKIAREMRQNISGLSKQRAEVIARTETIHAHAEGQLDSFEEMGMGEVELMAEWSTAGDDKVCDLCAPKDGEVMTIDDARGQIPLHPNCRCTWVPSVGEMKKKKAKEKPRA